MLNMSFFSSKITQSYDHPKIAFLKQKYTLLKPLFSSILNREFVVKFKG